MCVSFLVDKSYVEYFMMTKIQSLREQKAGCKAQFQASVSSSTQIVHQLVGSVTMRLSELIYGDWNLPSRYLKV